MLFAIIIPIFGCVSVFRIHRLLVARQLFLPSELTKIGTAYLALVLILAFALPHSRLSIWIAVFLPLLLLAVFVALVMQRRSLRFRDALAESLALVSLKMRGGKSFRQSLSEVTNESEPRLRAKLSEISRRVVFSQQNTEIARDSFIAMVIEELTIIDRQPHAASRRLQVFREKIRIESDFRRRSGQILSRIRAQSLLMTGLFLALAIFVATKFGWSRNIRIFATSAILFAIGALWIWWGGRNLKWKV